MSRKPAPAPAKRRAKRPEKAHSETTSATRLTIKDLISFKVSMVANSMSRGAASRYKDTYGVTLGEWRTIALLGAFAPMTLNEVARWAGLDKGQQSRVVSALVEQGIVSRVASANGGKAVDLSLTPKGTKIFHGLMKLAAERNDAFQACLLPAERQVLERALEKLAAVARALNAKSFRF